MASTVSVAMSATATEGVCPAAPWPAWTSTQQRMVTYDARVIDHSDPRKITTSEGQSYAMFFALVNHDKALFRDLVLWTETHLAKGDLSSNLPAWLWGRKPDGSWGVLDENSASDSDLWIAYNLLEAGRLWGEHAYASMGNQLLKLIAEREVAYLPGFGPMMLPAPYGFVQENAWRLNPSYVPPQLVMRAALARPDAWKGVAEKVPEFLLQSSPIGIAPDWTSWLRSGGFKPQSGRDMTGSYDAIRVYLWVGMLDDATPEAGRLKQHFRAIGRHVNDQGRVAERINIQTGDSESLGGPGFSAALLPLFNGQPLQKRLIGHIDSTSSKELGYYNQMLSLFGQGWHDQRYRFDKTGHLIPAWKACP